MDSYEEDEVYKDDIDNHKKVKSTWNAGEHYYKLLGRCKEAFFLYSTDGNINNLFWIVKDELSLIEPFIIKKSEDIKKINELMDEAERLLFNQVKGNLKNANVGIALRNIHEAWRLLNHIEAVNGLLQPLNKTPEQKIRQYGG